MAIDGQRNFKPILRIWYNSGGDYIFTVKTLYISTVVKVFENIFFLLHNLNNHKTKLLKTFLLFKF